MKIGEWQISAMKTLPPTVDPADKFTIATGRTEWETIL